MARSRRVLVSQSRTSSINQDTLTSAIGMLLGAGSAMGPFLILMALGANVITADLDRPNIWKRKITIAQQSPGTITFPLKLEQSSCTTNDKLYANAGCNLFTDTPRIRDWVLNLYPGKPMAVGSYAYLNGALHVQVSLAMDAICKDMSEKRKAGLAYLCTPTDPHVVTQEAHEASVQEYKKYSSHPYCILMKLLGNGKFLRKNAMKPLPGDGGDFYVVNGLSVAQGPNYTFAIRMQHWRAIIARKVSSNIAPATFTVSVVQNCTFAWAYEGMPYFKPYEIFAPKTSNPMSCSSTVHSTVVSGGVRMRLIASVRPLYLFTLEDLRSHGDDKIDFLEEVYKDHASITLAIRRSNIWPK